VLLFYFCCDEPRVPAEYCALFFIPFAGLSERVQPLNNPLSSEAAMAHYKADLVALQELSLGLFGASDMLVFAEKILDAPSDLSLSTGALAWHGCHKFSGHPRCRLGHIARDSGRVRVSVSGG
jgi:hypothetical protein